jgi:hypothetical protein
MKKDFKIYFVYVFYVKHIILQSNIVFAVVIGRKFSSKEKMGHMKVQLTATIEILGLITLTVSVLSRNPHTSSHIIENASDQTMK